MSFWKSRPKYSPTHFFVKMNTQFYLGKKEPKKLGLFQNFLEASHSKQRPKGRNFAESGHPASRVPFSGAKKTF
jgi:hypothetical protein